MSKSTLTDFSVRYVNEVQRYPPVTSSARALLAEAKTLWAAKVESHETRYLERFKYSARALNVMLVRYSRQNTVVDFQHPAMWAPYILMGCGEVVFGGLGSA